MSRAIQFGSFEHQDREINALHKHFDGPRSLWGNGETVMVVLKSHRLASVEVVGEDGSNEDGGVFRYADYFLPEEL